MGSFRYTWDDFGRGYYFGQLDNRQPKETFTGYNVTVANDDGALIAVDDVYNMNVVAGTRTFNTTAASGTGTVATITVSGVHSFSVGDTVTVANITPTGYRGTYTVTATPTTSSFSYANTTTGAQTIAGTATGPSCLVVNGNIRLPFKQSIMSGSFISSPVICSGRMFFVSSEFNVSTGQSAVYAYATSTNVVSDTNITVHRSFDFATTAGANDGYANICSDPVCVLVDYSTIHVYAAIGNKLLRWVFNPFSGVWTTGTPTQYTIPGFGTGEYVTDLFLWNSRMVATTTSDKLYFSDALDYVTWQSINYLAPGSSSDSILSAIPRGDDLYVFKPSGIFVVSGVLGASSYVRRYKNGVNINNIWMNSITEFDNQIFYISRNLYDPNNSNGKVVNLWQSIGNNNISIYYNFGLRQPIGYYLNTTLLQASGVSDYPSIATTANDHLVSMFTTPSVDPNYAANTFTVIDYGEGVWTKRRYPCLTTAYQYYYRYAPARTNSYVDDFTYSDGKLISNSCVPFFQISNYSSSNGASSPMEIAIGYYPIRQNGAGVRNGSVPPGFSSPYLTSGTFTSSAYTSQVPSKINRVYVEAEIYNNIGDPASSSSIPNMTVSVINSAVDDVEFLNSKTFESTPITYTANAISTIGNEKTTRVLRFDTNDTGYGYKHNVSITFKGMRIKSMWVEGENRS